jgi:hypothetical protein
VGRALWSQQPARVWYTAEKDNPPSSRSTSAFTLSSCNSQMLVMSQSNFTGHLCHTQCARKRAGSRGKGQWDMRLRVDRDDWGHFWPWDTRLQFRTVLNFKKVDL